MSYQQNGGRLIYALDDPYIHLAIAKNFALYGVWGVDSFSFSSSSSSLLWTAILTVLFRIFGANDYFPFIINLVVSVILILYLSSLLKKYLNPFTLLLALILIIFSTSIPLLIFTGLEHILHSLLTLLFASKVAQNLTNEEENQKENQKIKSFGISQIFILGFLVTSIRFEGIFIVFVVSLLFLFRRKYYIAFLLLFLGMLPILIFGLVSVQNGGFLFPNSVVLKGAMPDFSSMKGVVKFLGGFAFYQMIKTPELLVTFLLASMVLLVKISREKSIWDFSTLLLVIFLGTFLLHLQFAKVGWLFRYEAYLIVLGISTLIISLSDIIKTFREFHLMNKLLSWSIRVIILFVVLFPFISRSYRAFVSILPATRNIYEQQYQMAKFVKKYYQGNVVALNDIGFVNYIAAIRCIDLWGLANNEVARAILDKKYTTQKILEIAQKNNVSIAILYESWFKRYGGLPNEWKLIGKWEIVDNVACGDNVVSFFAVDTLNAAKLKNYLNEFKKELPPGVIIHY